MESQCTKLAALQLRQQQLCSFLFFVMKLLEFHITPFVVAAVKVFLIGEKA